MVFWLSLSFGCFFGLVLLLPFLVVSSISMSPLLAVGGGAAGRSYLLVPLRTFSMVFIGISYDGRDIKQRIVKPL